MDHQYAAMSLGEDDEGFLMYEDVSVDTVDFDDRWCLVGRFLTDRIELTYWVQIHGLIAGFRSETVLKDLGNYIGSYVKMDQNNFAGGWRDYLRIRAAPRRRSHTIGAKWLRPEMAGKQIGETSATPATSRSEVRIIPAQAGAEIMGGNRGVIDGDADILVHNFDLNGGGNKGDIIGKSAMGNNEEADMENQIVLEQKRRRVSMGINGELPQENMTMEHDMFDSQCVMRLFGAAGKEILVKIYGLNRSFV
ncbi:hypothetical protein F8388_027252 [Cannabis sativa]|uniref:Uncharacterized protein n=1 Tax=Cannabis sativa TaxID=3483 RepID=A0A7J6FS08_CANSA|nr:hypothetical protein F8388_027252 [Cannabis sativa]